MFSCLFELFILFKCRHLLLYTLLLVLLLLYPIHFCIHFLGFKVFSDFPFDFFDPMLMSFNFHTFLNFSIFFLLLTSNLIPLWYKKISDMISNFLNLLTYFMTYHVIFPWEYFMYPWEECVLCSCWVECSICVYYFNLVFSVALFFHFLIDLHSGWFTHYWKWSIDISSYYHIFTFSFSSVSVCFIYLITLMLDAYIVIPQYPCTSAYSKVDGCSRPLYKMT